MNTNRYLKLFGMLSLLALTCGQDCKSGDLCKQITGTQVCEVPFESVYSNRTDLVGKRVSIDGVLLVGAGGEFARFPVALLFPSVERAQVCHQAFAIELVAGSKSVFEKLKIYSGEIVNVSGILRRSENGHWAALEITKEPSTLMESHAVFQSCLKVPPPPPPPPSQEKKK